MGHFISAQGPIYISTGGSNYLSAIVSALFDNAAMTMAQESLAKQVLKWPARRRIELAEELLASVESFATSEIQAAWDEEIGARVKEIRAGRADGIPAEEVMTEARQKLHEARRLSSARRQRTRLRSSEAALRCVVSFMTQ